MRILYFILLAGLSFEATAQVYVNHAAQGINNGTSWLNAYTNLKTAIDKGVDLGNLPATDLDGNDRVNGCVDIGAFESNAIVSTMCVTSTQEVVVGKIILSPNPATDFIQLQLPESIIQPTEIGLFDAQGRLLEQRNISSGHVGVGHLPSGFYTLKLTDGELVYVGRFIKQ